MADEFIKPPKNITDSNFSSEVETFESNENFTSGPLAGTGIGCGNIKEPIPEFIQADCELVIKNRNNAYIVLGRDRPGTRWSGYAAAPFAYNTGMIDLVVGRGGPSPKSVDPNGEQNWVDNNFSFDAARIYISQTANIDKYFGITEEAEKRNVIPNSQGKSAIGIKADHVRVISRESIKLVTYQENRNSKGQSIGTKGRISLIANNDDTNLQPMIMGNNLGEFLEKLVLEIISVKDALYAFQLFQDQFNQTVAPHNHLSPYWGKEVKNSSALVQKGFSTKKDFFQNLATSCLAIESNLATLATTYLSTIGGKAIRSAYCYLN